MASLRDADITTNDGGGGIIKTIKLATAVTGDTITYKENVRSWIGVNETTADALNVTYGSNLFTVTVANTPDIAIHVIS